MSINTRLLAPLLILTILLAGVPLQSVQAVKVKVVTLPPKLTQPITVDGEGGIVILRGATTVDYTATWIQGALGALVKVYNAAEVRIPSLTILGKVRACCSRIAILYVHDVGKLTANRIAVSIDANVEGETVLKAVAISNVGRVEINTLQATAKIDMKYENTVQLVDVTHSEDVLIRNLAVRLEIHPYDDTYLCCESYSFHVCCANNLEIANAMLSTTLIARKPNTNIDIDLLFNMWIEETRNVRLDSILVTGPTIRVLAKNIRVGGYCFAGIAGVAVWDVGSLEAKRIIIRRVGDQALRHTLDGRWVWGLDLWDIVNARIDVVDVNGVAGGEVGIGVYFAGGTLTYKTISIRNVVASRWPINAEIWGAARHIYRGYTVIPNPETVSGQLTAIVKTSGQIYLDSNDTWIPLDRGDRVKIVFSNTGAEGMLVFSSTGLTGCCIPVSKLYVNGKLVAENTIVSLALGDSIVYGQLVVRTIDGKTYRLYPTPYMLSGFSTDYYLAL